MTTPLWILVADSSGARIFERKGRKAPLLELADWVHPEGRMLASEIENAPLGHSLAGRTGLAPRIDIKHRERTEFARTLAQWLHDQLPANPTVELVLFAADPFLGELVGQLDKQVHHKVRATHAVDLTALSTMELTDKLNQEFLL
jgi:protein required for attachment to host cells